MRGNVILLFISIFVFIDVLINTCSALCEPNDIELTGINCYFKRNSSYCGWKLSNWELVNFEGQQFQRLLENVEHGAMKHSLECFVDDNEGCLQLRYRFTKSFSILLRVFIKTEGLISSDLLNVNSNTPKPDNSWRTQRIVIPFTTVNRFSELVIKAQRQTMSSENDQEGSLDIIMIKYTRAACISEPEETTLTLTTQSQLFPVSPTFTSDAYYTNTRKSTTTSLPMKPSSSGDKPASSTSGDVGVIMAVVLGVLLSFIGIVVISLVFRKCNSFSSVKQCCNRNDSKLKGKTHTSHQTIEFNNHAFSNENSEEYGNYETLNRVMFTRAESLLYEVIHEKDVRTNVETKGQCTINGPPLPPHHPHRNVLQSGFVLEDSFQQALNSRPQQPLPRGDQSAPVETTKSYYSSTYLELLEEVPATERVTGANTTKAL